ncbi:lysylphosphatidylglycerol synthase transmembrane domain-containing protein [Halorutilales archaeon Cl-col2-1]
MEFVRQWTSRRGLFAVAGTALALGGLLVAFGDADFDDAVEGAVSADPLLLGVGVCVYAVSWLFRGRRYSDILGSMGHTDGLSLLTMAVLASQTVNLVLPARGGDPVRAYILKSRSDVPYTTGAASLVVERGFDLAAVLGISVVSASLLHLSGVRVTQRLPFGGQTALGVAGGAVGVGIGVALVYRRLPRLTLRGRLSSVFETLSDFVSDVLCVAGQPRSLVYVGAGTTAVWLLDVLTGVAVVYAVGVPLEPLTALLLGSLAVSVGNLAKVLPLSQGGVGLYEGGFTAVFVALSTVEPSVALAAAALDHLLKNAVTLVGGGIAFPSLGVSSTHEESEVF